MSLHPAVVHFPIALLLVSVVLTLLSLRRGGLPASLETTAYHCLVIGWLGASLAVLTGSIDAWRQVYGTDLPRDAGLLNRLNLHASLGLAVVAVYGMALLRRRRNPHLLADPQQRRGYVSLLLLGAVLLVVGSWLGGQLVYRFGVGVSR